MGRRAVRGEGEGYTASHHVVALLRSEVHERAQERHIANRRLEQWHAHHGQLGCDVALVQ